MPPRESMAATRRLGIRDGAEVVAVRRAVLEVTRGPDRGRKVELDGEGACAIGGAEGCDLRLTDDSVSQRHAEIVVERGAYVVRDLGSTNGTRIGGVLIREAAIDRRTVELSVGESELRLRQLDDEREVRLSLAERFGAAVGRAPAMRRVFDILERAAAVDSTVLLLGESGTGKEVLAESLHARSTRSDGPFVVVDCAALPPGLAESELFGHVQGAFTGASEDRAGALEEASGGTLFLDEIGELPLDLQPVLLRALDARQVRAVGADRYRPIDVRVVAATHRNLQREVEEGRFRADLFYRLSVVTVTVPPLRHRREDVPLLARALCAQLRPDSDPDELLSASMRAALAAHDWPGNVRELRNAIERILVLGDPGELAPAPGPESYHEARRRVLDTFEREYVRARLAECGGVMAQAATRAGISRQMFHRLARRHGRDGD